MNDPLLDSSVRQRMQGIRCDIDQGLEDVSANARNMVDWKHYVKTYPWVCLGTAAVLGFLIVPKRTRVTKGDLPSPTKAAQTSPSVVHSASGVTRGLVDALVAAVVGLAVREASTFLVQRAGSLLETQGHPRMQPHDS